MFECLDPVLGVAHCGRERALGANGAQRKVRFVMIGSLSTVVARQPGTAAWQRCATFHSSARIGTGLPVAEGWSLGPR